METEVKLTKLAGCAGCGAKVGAGTLVHLLEGFRTHTDPRLIVGYDKSDDASVYVLDENTALVQTTDFFPPIVDDPFLYGQIAAANALSDVYAMGGEPRLALNIMCLAQSMDDHAVQEILRGGYDKAYEAGAIITGGHTIQGAEPIYGLAVSGFVHPKKVLTNSGAKPGDVLILTKPLGVGVLTTAAKAGLVEKSVLDRIYRQMAALNKAIAEVEDLNENYQIGASYFLKLKTLDFDQLWTDYLQPLLQEYIQGMYDEEGIMNRFARAYGYQKPARGDANEAAQDQG